MAFMPINDYLFRMMLEWVISNRFKPCIYNILLWIKVAVVKYLYKTG